MKFFNSNSSHPTFLRPRARTHRNVAQVSFLLPEERQPRETLRQQDPSLPGNRDNGRGSLPPSPELPQSSPPSSSRSHSVLHWRPDHRQGLDTEETVLRCRLHKHPIISRKQFICLKSPTLSFCLDALVPHQHEAAPLTRLFSKPHNGSRERSNSERQTDPRPALHHEKGSSEKEENCFRNSTQKRNPK